MKLVNFYAFLSWAQWIWFCIYARLQKIFLRTRALPPRRVIFMITNQCNCSCPMCNIVVAGAKKEYLTVQDVVNVLKQVPKGAIVTLGGGEPAVSPEFWPILERAVKDHRTLLFTNGVIWNGSMIERLMKTPPWGMQFSVDAPRADIHDGVRAHPGAFNKVCWAIEETVRVKRTKRQLQPLVGVTMVILPETIPYLSEMVDFCIQRHVDVLLMMRYADYFSCGHGRAINPELLRKELVKANALAKKGGLCLRYRTNFTMEDAAKYYSHPQTWAEPMLTGSNSQFECLASWQTLPILPNGDVTVCYHTVVGNIKTEKVEEIWNGIRMRKQRELVLKNQLMNQNCLNCCYLCVRS